jgi:hypothetical protein
MNNISPKYFHVFRFWTFSLSRQERPGASACPSVRIYRRGSQRKDFREICYWRLYENLPRHCKFGYILTKISVFLHEDLSVFHIFDSDTYRAAIHLSILAKWPIWPTILFCVFISVLCMFRATSCSSSGESIVSIQHLIYVALCRWPFRMQVDLHRNGHRHRLTCTRCCIDTIDSPDDEHEVAGNMQRIEINT